MMLLFYLLTPIKLAFQFEQKEGTVYHMYLHYRVSYSPKPGKYNYFQLGRSELFHHEKKSEGRSRAEVNRRKPDSSFAPRQKNIASA